MSMNEDREMTVDERIEGLFAAAASELDGAAFTADVMCYVHRSRRRRAVRTAVLGCAAAVGLAFALGPAVDLLQGLAYAARGVQWNGDAWLEMYRLPVAVVVFCALAWPVLVRWLAR